MFDEELKFYALVAVPVPVHRIFTYSVPESIRGDIATGSQVLVPFGQRVMTGVVTALTGHTDVKRVKPVKSIVHGNFILRPEIINMALRIADTCMCSPGEALKVTLPPGTARNSRRMIERLDVQSDVILSPLQQKVLDFIEGDPKTIIAMRRRLGKVSSSVASFLVRKGLVRIFTQDPSAGMKSKTRQFAVISQLGRDVLQSGKKLSPARNSVLHYLASIEKPETVMQVMHNTGTSRAVIKTMERAGLVNLPRMEVVRDPLANMNMKARPRPEKLTSEQVQAASAIISAVDEGTHMTFLLHGVTGSGKTEVYMQAIDRCLEIGKSSLVLVPEIALTPQLASDFRQAYHERVAVFHSQLSQGERFDAWRRADAGTIRVVVGARSAVFAPLSDLGLVIMDEEHEHSYKQGENPRYHARTVAAQRAADAGAVLVLGSATPDVRTYHSALSGEICLLELKHRAAKQAMPEVLIADMRKRSERGAFFSHLLADELGAALYRGEQAIIFLNRRGHSSTYICTDCGQSPSCPDCDIALTYHMHGDLLRCHYCGYSEPAPHTCPACGTGTLRRAGTGTQRVEKEIMKRFPRANVIRMDSDTTTGKDSHSEYLNAFGRGDANVLVGTQMVAKGLDFPNVTLVGVVMADIGMNLPEYVAGERTFQLLSQVAGRCGRGDRPGKVIIQTYRPDHYAIVSAVNHDYRSFYDVEIANRKAALYPPFSHLAAVWISAVEQKAALTNARQVAGVIRDASHAGLVVLGPAEAPMHHLRGRYRYTILCKSPSMQDLLETMSGVRDFKTGGADTRVHVDIDPLSML